MLGRAVVAELREKGTTRAQDILAMLPAYYEQVAAESRKADPDPSRERGGGEHGEFAVDVICALHRDEGRRMIVNTRNNGAISSLDPDAVVEVPALVGRRFGVYIPPEFELLAILFDPFITTRTASIPGTRRSRRSSVATSISSGAYRTGGGARLPDP